MKEKPLDFDLLLAEAVHEGLSSISPSISSVVFFYLKKKETIQSGHSINDPQKFQEGLKEIFGFGAKVIEKKILEVLYLKLAIPRKLRDDFEFAREVKSAQRLLESGDLIVEKAH